MSTVLPDVLEFAVLLCIGELQRLRPDVRERRIRTWAAGAVDEVASRGDVLQYGGRRGEAAQVFNHLARGLAALAHCPGGVTFAGRHWCVDHDVCTGVAPAERAASQPAPRRPWAVVDKKVAPFRPPRNQPVHTATPAGDLL